MQHLYSQSFTRFLKFVDVIVLLVVVLYLLAKIISKAVPFFESMVNFPFN